MAQAKYLELFGIIDSNGDGFIDMPELVAAFTSRGLDQANEEAQLFFEKSDLDKNKVLDKEEFLQYMVNHENEMQAAFAQVDANADGVVDKDEVIAAFKLRGINVDIDQIHRLVKQADTNRNSVIDWDEWREFLLFRSSNTLVSGNL